MLFESITAKAQDRNVTVRRIQSGCLAVGLSRHHAIGNNVQHDTSSRQYKLPRTS
jgi:hypothetical protein